MVSTVEGARPPAVCHGCKVINYCLTVIKMDVEAPFHGEGVDKPDFEEISANERCSMREEVGNVSLNPHRRQRIPK